MFLDRSVSAGSRPVMHLPHSFTYIDQRATGILNVFANQTEKDNQVCSEKSLPLLFLRWASPRFRTRQKQAYRCRIAGPAGKNRRCL